MKKEALEWWNTQSKDIQTRLHNKSWNPSEDEILEIYKLKHSDELLAKELLGVPDEYIDGEDWSHINFGIRVIKHLKQKHEQDLRDAISVGIQLENSNYLTREPLQDRIDREIQKILQR